MGIAKELILTGDHIPAARALEIGLVNHVVPYAELDALVAKIAGKIAAKSPIALHMAKAAVNNGSQADLRTALDYEARCFSLCFGSEDKAEGTNAFLEKRKPQFKGR